MCRQRIIGARASSFAMRMQATALPRCTSPSAARDLFARLCTTMAVPVAAYVSTCVLAVLWRGLRNRVKCRMSGVKTGGVFSPERKLQRFYPSPKLAKP